MKKGISACVCVIFAAAIHVIDGRPVSAQSLNPCANCTDFAPTETVCQTVTSVCNSTLHVHLSEVFLGELSSTIAPSVECRDCDEVNPPWPEIVLSETTGYEVCVSAKAGVALNLPGNWLVSGNVSVGIEACFDKTKTLEKTFSVPCQPGKIVGVYVYARDREFAMFKSFQNTMMVFHVTKKDDAPADPCDFVEDTMTHTFPCNPGSIQSSYVVTDIVFDWYKKSCNGNDEEEEGDEGLSLDEEGITEFLFAAFGELTLEEFLLLLQSLLGIDLSHCLEQLSDPESEPDQEQVPLLPGGSPVDPATGEPVSPIGIGEHPGKRECDKWIDWYEQYSSAGTAG